MEYFQNLPEDITLEILTRLPTESVLDCKSVCTNWNNLVSRHPSFNKMHLHRLNHPFADNDSGKLGFIALTMSADRWDHELRYFEYDDSDELTPSFQGSTRFIFTPPSRRLLLLGSCNGLVCLTPDFLVMQPKPVCICNPITKQHIMLPVIKTKDVYRTYGFGYVSSTKEYKVVSLYLRKRTEFLYAHIYTLGSGNGWRKLGKFNPEFGINPWDQAIFANEALYWVSRELEMIVTFDLAEEKFCEHLSPPPLPSDNEWEIGVLDGFLFSAVWQEVEGGADYFDIWLLKKNNDNHDIREQGEEQQSLGWTREFRVYNSNLLALNLVALTKTDKVLTYTDNYLNIYDPTTPTSTSKMLVNVRDRICRVLPHMNTLVSLNEFLGEEDSKIKESVEIEETESDEETSSD